MREVKTEDIFGIPRILIFARKPRQNYWQGNAIVLGAKSARGDGEEKGGQPLVVYRSSLVMETFKMLASVNPG